LLFGNYKSTTSLGNSDLFHAVISLTGQQCNRLLELPKVEHIVVNDSKQKYLHTKMFYFESGAKFTAIIGSANLTIGGLVQNEELSTEITGIIGSIEHSSIFKYLKRLSCYQ